MQDKRVRIEWQTQCQWHRNTHASTQDAQQLELRQDNLGIAEVALEQHLGLERELNLGGGGIARRVVVGISATAVACKRTSKHARTHQENTR